MALPIFGISADLAASPAGVRDGDDVCGAGRSSAVASSCHEAGPSTVHHEDVRPRCARPRALNIYASPWDQLMNLSDVWKTKGGGGLSGCRSTRVLHRLAKRLTATSAPELDRRQRRHQPESRQQPSPLKERFGKVLWSTRRARWPREAVRWRARQLSASSWPSRAPLRRFRCVDSTILTSSAQLRRPCSTTACCTRSRKCVPWPRHQRRAARPCRLVAGGLEAVAGREPVQLYLHSVVALLVRPRVRCLRAPLSPTGTSTGTAGTAHGADELTARCGPTKAPRVGGGAALAVRSDGVRWTPIWGGRSAWRPANRLRSGAAHVCRVGTVCGRAGVAIGAAVRRPCCVARVYECFRACAWRCEQYVHTSGCTVLMGYLAVLVRCRDPLASSGCVGLMWEAPDKDL